MKQKRKRIESHLTVGDLVRIHVFPLLAVLCRKLGFSWTKVGKSVLGTSTLIGQASQIRKTVREVQSDRPLKVYFLTMLGGHSHNVSIDVVLAWGLSQLGHKVYFILDDGSLPISEDTRSGDEARWDRIKARSFSYGYNYIVSAGFQVLKISEIINVDEERNISEFDSLIEAGLLKHYKVGVLNHELADVVLKKRMLQESAKISALIADFLIKQGPDRVIMSHGIYPTWGPAFNILNAANIPIVTYGRGKKAHTQKFNWNMTSDWWDVSEEWLRVRDVPLTEEQGLKIDKYLKSRVSHSQDVLVYNFGEFESKERTLERFNLDPSKLTYCLFTNVLWDAASAQREIAFKNPIEWVCETINWFSQHPEKQLIVKIHPAEVVIGTNQPFANLIKQMMPKLPKNVRLISPNEKVNSWSIYEITDLGIVHTTTAGMELQLSGIPCVVVSNTHYRGKGFTIDINSRDEYFRFLDCFNGKEIDRDKLKMLSRRYAYLLFERYQIPFNLLYELKPLLTVALKIEAVDDILKDNFIKLIINNIIYRTSFLLNE